MPSPVAVNRNIVEMEYAVRGPIPQRAAELARQGRATIACNIGNPQALGQKPITFYRQVLSLVEDPSKIARERKLRQLVRSRPQALEGLGEDDLVPEYVLDVSERILEGMKTGTGAYTESMGPLFIREAVAAFIDRRDGVEGKPALKADPGKIFLTNGASEAAKHVIEALIGGPKDGIMIPIPQYPLYSATIRKCGGTQVNYYPDEEKGWVLTRGELERSLAEARAQGVAVKAIVVINPGNPTGAVLDAQVIIDVVAFAKTHGLAVIADEVYQDNLYGAEFVSFAKAVGADDVPLFSLHSVSKGFFGECGHRGGYLEVRNPPKIAGCDRCFTDILVKQASVCLCSNTIGQVLVYLMVNPPPPGSEPHERFSREKKGVLDDLQEKARIIKDSFQRMDGMECFGRTGALYLFPRIKKLPERTTDFDYCMALLEETGLCTVNGSGFGQKEGTHHLRVAFLPPKEMLKGVLEKWIQFHNRYVSQ